MGCSPCQHLCQLDQSQDVCLGCGRHVSDIAAWRTMTDEEKAVAREKAQKTLEKINTQ
ncbi:DUF1289 domain-containing protein [Limnobacter sp.]|uniref:DUF1289 domain-containing protein n=1 Tax=Limnobacter sp. TaxID=2003368 RepID=UPI0034503360